ncbi:MAG TPA: hypothetical protein VHS06_04355 [Chloroflexota bacterium]|nr:hypothetical protein [Chloroflexota bacterium]
MHRCLTAVVTFVMAAIALTPSALSLPQHIDEVQYAYISDYFGGKISRLDFTPVSGSDEWLDPGWSPSSFWALTQPMGPRYLYAAALGITQAPPPARPWIWGDFVSYNPLTQLTDGTRNTIRFTAVLLSALGLALIAYRLGWSAVVAIVVFLLIPHVREDLARGWAEGPLLFGLGLAAAAWGTRWFAPACGFAVAVKLNALPLLLLAFYGGFGRSRYRHILGVTVALVVWTILMPPAWYSYGPAFLVLMILMRWVEFGSQSRFADPEVWGGLFGHYFPTRYLWPVELVVLLTAMYLVARYRHRLVRLIPLPRRRTA